MSDRHIPVVTREEFRRLADANPRLLQDSPWIVSGYIEDWPRYRQWQDIDYLRERFGTLRAFAKAPNFITHKRASLVSVETRFDQYLDYIREPHRVGEIYEGCWMDGDLDAFRAQPLPLYCGTLRIVHRADDPVFSEITPIVPEPVVPWNHALPYYYALFNHLWLLVSLPGALTPLHRDNNGTIALVAQLKGRKRAILYAPNDFGHIFNSEVGYLDPLAPDRSEFPTWDAATRWVGEIEPGQVIFIGTNWAHHVETLEHSISVSFDFVEHSNLADYAVADGWAGVFGNRIKRNPAPFLQKLGGAFDPQSVAAMEPVELGRRAMAEILEASFLQSADPTVAEVRRRYLEYLRSCTTPTPLPA